MTTVKTRHALADECNTQIYTEREREKRGKRIYRHSSPWQYPLPVVHSLHPLFIKEVTK